jgi:hypothetical protein
VVRSDNTIWRGTRNNAQSYTDYTGALTAITAKLGQMTDAHTAMIHAPDLAPLVSTYRALRPKVQALVGSGGGFQSNQAAIQTAEKALDEKVNQMLAGTLAPTVGYYLKGLK